MSGLEAAEPPLPSPPESPSKAEDHHPYGLTHLADFNASNQSQFFRHLPEGSHYASVDEQSGFDSGEGAVVRAIQPALGGIGTSGFREAYDGFDGANHDTEHTNYQIAPISIPHFANPEHFGNTPPVTPPALLETDHRRTRHRNIVSGDTKYREQRKNGAIKNSGVNSPRPKKPKEVKSSKRKHEKQDDSPIDMPVPLFEMLLDIPLVDAEAYIRRPRELREEEWKNRRDFPKMPRPVNVFLLYRRAVSERAKKYAGVTNHQVVSKIAGASWKNESDEVKDIFNHYAELEKEYHDKAFPDYKFNPKKTQSAKANKGKNKGEYGDDQSNGDDDPEYMDHTSTRRKKAKVVMKQAEITEPKSPHTWQYAAHYEFEHPTSMPNMPYPTDPRYLPHEGTYGQMSAHYDPRFDVGDFRRNSQLDMITSNAATRIGLPGGNHDLLLGNAAPMEQPGHFDANAIDPNLFSFDSHDDGFFPGDFDGHDGFAPSNLEYIQGGDFSVSPRQHQDWELNEDSTPINNPNFEEVFDQTKE